MNEIDFPIVAGIPFSDYPEKPKDLPNSFLVDCPKCSDKMWFTKSKEEIEKSCIISGLGYMKACWNCVKKYFENNPEEEFKNYLMVRIDHK